MAVDAPEYYPFTNGIATEAQWSVYMRAMLTNGVLLGELNLLEPYGDGGGMQVKFKTGQAHLRGFMGRWPSGDTTVPVTANASGQARIDRLVVRLNLTLLKVQADVKVGTPGINPTAAALQQDDTIWEESLAQIRIPSGATSITADMVTDERGFARAPGVELGRPQATFEAAPANIAEVFAQGQTLSRVTYGKLMAIPGIVAGPGDGATTWKIVDLRKQVLGGRSSGDAIFGGALGSSAGAVANTMSIAQMPVHNHTGTTSAESTVHTHGFATPFVGIGVLNGDSVPAGGWANRSLSSVWGSTFQNSGNTGGQSVAHSHAVGNDGGGQPFPVVQPTTLVNYVVRAR